MNDYECKKLTLSDLKPTKQYAVLHKGDSYSFQSDKPIGDDVVACFDLAHSEKPLGEDFFDENRQDDKQMKTYNTYQEAKIANPECEVANLAHDNGIKDHDESGMYIGCFTPVVKDGSKRCGYAYFDKEMRGSPNMTDGCWVICNPSDYCMTVKEFLDAGYGFEIGDLFVGTTGRVVAVNDKNIDTVNIAAGGDKNRYILRAAALEEKPRTKVEYVKVTDSIFDLKDDFEGGLLYSKHKSKDKYYQINTELWVVSAMNNNNLYRRIETPMTEREAFIDECQKYGSWEEMFDSGKFKLVN